MHLFIKYLHCSLFFFSLSINASNYNSLPRPNDNKSEKRFIKTLQKKYTFQNLESNTNAERNTNSDKALDDFMRKLHAKAAQTQYQNN